MLEADLPGPSSPSAGLHGKDVYVLDVCGCCFERQEALLLCPA